MELTRYAESVRHQLLVAAEAGGPDARALAERLVAPLESAIRLTLLDALSAAADEITRELAPGSVDLRLRGLEPGFVVTPPPGERWDEPAAAPGPPVARPPVAPPPAGDDEGATARINFRPPEQLKFRIEEAASRDGLSVNAWLIRALSDLLATAAPRTERRSPSGGQSFTGWVR